jgi:hypothetical protein
LTRWLRPCLVAAAAALASHGTARAADAPEEPVRVDVRLMAADLTDELVYAWQASRPTPARAQVVLAEVVAPVGLDERFNVMVENRLFELLRQNPQIELDLVHCAICTRLVAKSNPQGTLLARGIDQPEVLADLVRQYPGRLALSLAFEAEGRELVLRAELFELAGAQRIVWAKTFSTSLAARRTLQEATPLVSLEAARAEQQKLIARQDPLEASTRVVVRTYNTADDAPIAAAPLPFAEFSFEATPLPARRLRAGFTIGATSIKDSLEAFTVGGHLARLLLREAPSLVSPDLYLFMGMHYIRMRGPGALPFGEKQPDLDTVRGISHEPRASLVAYRLGLETHVKFRLGALAFLEYSPQLKNSESINTERLVGIPYQAYGWGMVIRW